MRIALVASVLLAVALSTPAAAQEWSAEQQEIIDFAHACWTTWSSEDWEAYESACPMDPDARYWDTSEGVPTFGHESWKPFAEAMWPRMESIHYEHRPIAVQIFGDVATYYFFAAFTWELADGQIAQFTQHELAVFQRQNGQWILIGGAWTTFPRQ